MDSQKIIHFESMRENVGRFQAGDKLLLIPEMGRSASHLIAAAFRAFGIRSHVLETFKGLDLGKEHTSGKECFPCEITTGDILYFLKQEKERLGAAFKADDYAFFMPEAEGPCRFGMYNKYQRIVLDSFPDLQKVKIVALTSSDGYSLSGFIEDHQVQDLRKTAYAAVVTADILDRAVWRVRPYEKTPGAVDAFYETSLRQLTRIIETEGARKKFNRILDALEKQLETVKSLLDPSIPAKPLVGVVGEIYLRSHVQANQDLLRKLEHYGAEVVNASTTEWVNFVNYSNLRSAKFKARLSFKQRRWKALKNALRKMLTNGGTLFYQESCQRNAYRRARKILDLAEDHRISHLDHILQERNLFSFDVGTEACLSIASIWHCAREGFNGVVNVYPFSCMPSTTTSAVIRPLINELRVPYLDTPYDGSFQPGREAALRTFMYQVHQHFERHGRKHHG